MMRSHERTRRGFSLIETSVVSLLLVVLSIMLTSVWVGLCRPTLDGAARCRMILEANLAATALARDLGGFLADDSGRLGNLDDGQFVGRQIPSSNHLRLCYHGSGAGTDLTPLWASPDTVISYQLQGTNLVRWNEAGGGSVVVANCLTSFDVEPLSDGTGIQITMQFAARDLSLTYTLVAVDPSVASP